jgi:DNA helicase HerA-like ATPase
MVTAGIVQAVQSGALGDSAEVFAAGKSESDSAGFDRDRPIRFEFEEFINHIDWVQGRKAGKVDSLSQSDRKSHDSILDKLTVLRTDPRLKFLMNSGPQELSLADVIDQFTGAPDDKTLKIIDISGLPNEVAGPLAALISRLLFNYKVWQSREEREKDPLLLVCEEAHRYVPNFGDAQYKEAQEAIRRIAKEGRKYGIGLMLVSQRPSDVESTVLSQCNSWIIMRLTNANDQEHVSRFLPDSLLGLTRIVSSLSRREAIFVGEAAVLPSRIKITELSEEKLPGSQDISFVAGWNTPPLSKTEIETVVSRWLKG